MQTITADKYCECVESIFVEQPDYREGGDGSDGTCDCIGMGRGALERAGVTDVSNMRGTNQAARKTIKNLQKLKSVDQLRRGDVVLKVRDKDYEGMKLPDRYRKGGADYDPNVGEINFTHFGTVYSVNPLVITHMTSPKPQKDTKLGRWEYFGQLPWVSEDAEPDPDVVRAMVYADSGKTVKMRAKPSVLCRLYWDVPIGDEVIIMKPGETWSEIIWSGRTGYMMNKYLNTSRTYAVVIPGLSEEAADQIVSIYPGAYKEIERG